MRYAGSIALVALLIAGAPAAQEGRPAPTRSSLDFTFYRAHVEPLFLVKRPGLMACVECHERGAGGLRFQPLANGGWSEEASRKNFAAVSAWVTPGRPDASRLLKHPLAPGDGGDPFHGGGKHWTGRRSRIPHPRGLGRRRDRALGKDRGRASIQTNSAGDSAHVIDPATRRWSASSTTCRLRTA